MEQYIDKVIVISEIEKKLQDLIACKKDAFYPEERITLQARINMCKEILSFLETLKMKEVDLEEKATQLSQKYFPDEENIWARPNIEAQMCKSACIEMVEWLKAQKGE